jgi:endonuclease/exonuclease/phosphatase family metal-dependent hydrolase
VTLAVLVGSVVTLVIRQQDDSLPPSTRAAALADSHDRGSDPARGANRTAPRAFHVTKGVSLRPKHPAFYRLSLHMAKRGYVLRQSPKGRTTHFVVSSFNVLGAGHTAAKGGMGPGVARMHAAVGLLLSNDVSVAGLQEFQEPQYRTFQALVGGTYDAYPGLSLGVQPVQNSIVWRSADWSLVEAHTLSVPYFHGHHVPMPYVLLRNRHSGREVWFYNSHNPANAYGPAAHWRAIATSLEAHLVRSLTADGTPMIVTGDMNDREPFACPFASGSGMHSADGVFYSGGCHLPRRMNVDWIFGSHTLDFSSFVTDRSTQTRRISDHPMVRSAVTVPAVADPRCRRAFGFGWFCPHR